MLKACLGSIDGAETPCSGFGCKLNEEPRDPFHGLEIQKLSSNEALVSSTSIADLLAPPLKAANSRVCTLTCSTCGALEDSTAFYTGRKRHKDFTGLTTGAQGSGSSYAKLLLRKFQFPCAPRQFLSDTRDL